MGFTRKVLSVSSAGLVDFRSDKERIARKTAKGARAAKRANKLTEQQTAAIERQTAALERATQVAPVASPAPTPTGPPPGFYQLDGVHRWWDGTRWTEHVQGAQ